jgi:MFS family permease
VGLDGYLLSLSALLLSGGAAGDRYGLRRVFVGGLVIFTMASLACGFSPTVGWLIGARLVQGLGAAAVMLGLAGAIYALIEAPSRGWTPITVTAAAIGATSFMMFALIETHTDAPLLPLELFRSRQFTGANVTTLAVYAALGGALFLLALQLQQSLHYSALAAGLATLPTTVIMLIGSPFAGAVAERTGHGYP